MGMNYYLELDVCPTCNVPKRKFHIGKGSMGWTFSFRGYRKPYDAEHIGKPITSYRDWIILLPTGRIVNEEGEEIAIDFFKKLVESKVDGEFNHTTYCRKEYKEYAERSCWLDEDGHSFSDDEFT